MIAGGNHTIMQRESKDLGTEYTANVNKMRRFFDSALRAPLRMTGFSFHPTVLQTIIMRIEVDRRNRNLVDADDEIFE